jgi:transcription initiation factor IIE alpha subunit
MSTASRDSNANRSSALLATERKNGTVTDTQLYLAIGVPVISNAIMLLLFSTLINSRIAAFENAINRRFDDMRTMWTAELRRVEEVLDARLKHLEETK